MLSIGRVRASQGQCAVVVVFARTFFESLFPVGALSKRPTRQTYMRVFFFMLARAQQQHTQITDKARTRAVDGATVAPTAAMLSSRVQIVAPLRRSTA